METNQQLNSDFIYKIEVEITANCNASCPLCARTAANMPLQNNDEITFDEFKKIFPSEVINGKLINFCGVLGDPIVHPELLEIIEYVIDSGADRVQISTNAGYQTSEWWSKLGSMAPKKIRVDFAVDGHKETNHIYRVNTKWNIVSRNMEAYCAAGGKGSWIYIPFDHNEHEIELAREHATQLDLKFKIRQSGRNSLNTKVVSERKTGTQVEITSGKKYNNDSRVNKIKQIRAINSENDLSKDQLNQLLEFSKTIACKTFKEKHMYLGADKKIYPCCFLYDENKSKRKNFQFTVDGMDSDWNDATKYSIEEILQSKPFQELTRRWDPRNPEYTKRCLNSCGDKGNYHNKKIEIK